MQCGGVTAVRQYDLEKRPIIIQFDRLVYCQAVQGDSSLTEERMQKIVRHSREIRVILCCSTLLRPFTMNVEFYIQVYVRVIIGGEQKI